jgi:hypothetical protein
MQNLRENKYAIRLIEEWRIHGKIIIGTGYDDTLKYWKFNPQEICDKVINVLTLCKEIGAYIVIHTSSDEDRYEEIMSFGKSKGLEIDAINKNPINLPYGNNTKIYANIFIDDRAGMEEALEILEFAAYTIRSERHSASTQTVEF